MREYHRQKSAGQMRAPVSAVSSPSILRKLRSGGSSDTTMFMGRAICHDFWAKK
jgi:hypothetical protein